MTSDKKLFNKLRHYTGYAVPVVLTIVFLYLAFQNVDLVEAFNLISQASLSYLFIFFIVFAFSHFLRAVRWKIILRSVKPDASLLNLTGALMVGYGVNCVVPRLGELYRALFMGRWENLSRSSMLGTIIVERVIDIMSLFISVLISVFIYSGDLYEEVAWLKSTMYLGSVIILLIAVMIILIVKLKEKFYNVILKVIGKVSSKAADKLGYIFAMMVDGFSSLKGTKNYILTIFYSALIMVVYGLTSYFGFFMLHLDSYQEVTYGMAWILMTISAFGIVFPTPGGTGSYHAIVIFVLVSIFKFSEEISAAYALLTHLISYITFIFSTVLFIYFINRKQHKSGSTKENFLSVFKMTKDEV